jgi:hypothetical protein
MGQMAMDFMQHRDPGTLEQAIASRAEAMAEQAMQNPQIQQMMQQGGGTSVCRLFFLFWVCVFLMCCNTMALVPDMGSMMQALQGGGVL